MPSKALSPGLRVRVLRVRKYCHDPDFARVPLAHQMAYMIILSFKNNLYFAVNQLAKILEGIEEVYCHDRFRPIFTDLIRWLA